MSAVLARVWGALGAPSALFFGQETAGVLVWSLCVFSVRCLLSALGLERALSPLLQFALPLAMHCLCARVRFMRGTLPHLPSRLAEAVLGRLDAMQFVLLIPAHIMGAVLAIATLRALLPQMLIADGLSPLLYAVTDPEEGEEGRSIILRWMGMGVAGAWCLLAEVAVSAIFSIAAIALPELVAVNRISPAWISLIVLPLMRVHVPDRASMSAPAHVFALWYAGKGERGLFQQGSHILGPMLGGLVAGLICARFFPDDPHYRRKPPMY